MNHHDTTQRADRRHQARSAETTAFRARGRRVSHV